MNRVSLIKRISIFIVGIVLLRGAAQTQEATADPVLEAMRAELSRSKEKLQLEQMQRPYFIEYRLVEDDSWAAEAAFGAMRIEQHQRNRFIRAIVRVGDYKQDSSGAGGEGITDLAPLDNDVIALRHRL